MTIMQNEIAAEIEDMFDVYMIACLLNETLAKTTLCQVCEIVSFNLLSLQSSLH